MKKLSMIIVIAMIALPCLAEPMKVPARLIQVEMVAAKCRLNADKTKKAKLECKTVVIKR